jgi:hypothetical protein
MAEKNVVTLAALTFCQLYHRMLAFRSRHSAWDGNGVRRMARGLASFLATPGRSAGSKAGACSRRTISLEFGRASPHARCAGDARRRLSDRIVRRIAPGGRQSGYPAELLINRISLRDAIIYSLPSVHGLHRFRTKAGPRSARHRRLARAFHNRQTQTSRLGEKHSRDVTPIRYSCHHGFRTARSITPSYGATDADGR